MKSLRKIIYIFLILILIYTINSATIKKKASSRTKTYSKKQTNDDISSNMISQVGTTGNENANNDRDAVTYGIGGSRSIRLSDDHPIIADMRRAKYVEKLHYFEDAPTLGSLEANTIDRLDENFYLPFQSGQIKHVSVTDNPNCDSFNSPYVCQGSHFCGWDAKLMSCFVQRVPHPLYNLFRFRGKKNLD